eukprot:341745-Rhodomonas_salina.1
MHDLDSTNFVDEDAELGPEVSEPVPEPEVSAPAEQLAAGDRVRPATRSRTRDAAAAEPGADAD